MHLTPDEFIDIAEGARAEASAPHLAACAACRSHLSDLRAALSATLSATADVPVPEPSPLFWNHLSERVTEAVAAEPPAARSWWDAWVRPQALLKLSAAAVAVVLVAIVLNAPVLAPHLLRPAPRTVQPSASVMPAQGTPSASVSAGHDRDVLTDAATGDDDPSLALVAELTADMDWDTAEDAGLASRGSAEHAVTHLSDGDLRELQRLLEEELVHRGA